MGKTLIIPSEFAFIEPLKEYDIGLYANSPHEVKSAFMRLGDSLKINFVIIDSSITLDRFPFDVEWGHNHIYLFSPGIGEFCRFVENLTSFDRNKFTIYFDASNDTFSRDIQILSSLGIRVGVRFERKVSNWKELLDVLTYSFYRTYGDSPIEPFNYALKNFRGGVSHSFPWLKGFDDPDKYLWVSLAGDIACSKQEMENKKYIGHVNKLNEAHDCASTQANSGQWQHHMLLFDDCSCCAGWRVCGGYLSFFCDRKDLCREFCVELIEAVHLKNEGIPESANGNH